MKQTIILFATGASIILLSVSSVVSCQLSWLDYILLVGTPVLFIFDQSTR